MPDARRAALIAFAGMIHTLSVSLELCRIEVHVPEIAGAVALRLVVEVGRRRVAALSTRGDCPRTHAVTELDHRDEAVAAGAVPLLRSRIRARRKRRQRSPPRRRKWNRNARRRVVELGRDVVGDALEPVDHSPRRPPGPEIVRELGLRADERLKALPVGRAIDDVCLGRHPRLTGFSTDATLYILSPEDRD